MNAIGEDKRDAASFSPNARMQLSIHGRKLATKAGGALPPLA